MFAAWPMERWYEARATFLSTQGDASRATLAAHHARAAGYGEAGDRLRREIDRAQRARQSTEDFELARLLFETGQVESGLRALERSVEADSENVRAWAVLGDKRRQARDWEGARVALGHAATSPDPDLRTEVAIVSGLIEIGREQPMAAARHFRAAQGLSPARAKPYALEALALQKGGDADGARDAVRRGLVVAPADPELQAIRRELERAR
jgi:Flp pilus assembly protein TadD